MSGMRLLLGKQEMSLQRHLSISCLGFEINSFWKRYLQSGLMLVTDPCAMP